MHACVCPRSARPRLAVDPGYVVATVHQPGLRHRERNQVRILILLTFFAFDKELEDYDSIGWNISHTHQILEARN